MSDVQVVPVATRRDLEDFVALPYALFRDDPLFVQLQDGQQAALPVQRERRPAVGLHDQHRLLRAP